MNRIRELREQRGLTGEQLAERVGTTQGQIHKLESGKRRLTVEWMQRIAKALNVRPIDLIQTALAAGLQDDIEPLDPAGNALLKAIASRGLKFYAVISDAMARRGYAIGDAILVDGTQVDAIPDGATVVVRLSAEGLSAFCLRQFAAPTLLLTNRPSQNELVDMEDTPLEVELVGVVVERIEQGAKARRPS
jgi:transcriptional regulator with XRE-family HTH domain